MSVIRVSDVLYISFSFNYADVCVLPSSGAPRNYKKVTFVYFPKSIIFVSFVFYSM